MSNKLKTTLIISVLFLLPVLFFWYFIFDVASMATDGCYAWYPLSSFWVNSVRTGQLPLWNPFDYSGRPGLADPLMGMFYPLFLPMLLATKHNILSFLAIEYLSIFHIFLAGLFTYFFARELNLSYFSSLIAAVAYMFCGNVVALLDTPPQVAPIWLPFILLFLTKALSKQNYKYSIIGGIGLGMSGLCLHPQYQIFLLYTLGLYCVLHKEKNRWKLFLVILMVGLCISAVQLLPSFELAMNSNRAKITWLQSVYGSMHPKKLLKFILPFAFKEYSTGLFDVGWEEYYIYIGILPFLFGLFGMLYSKHPQKKSFIIFFVVSLFYAFGKFAFIQPLFYHILPGFNKIRAPTRISWVYDFALVMLAGMGIDRLHIKSAKIKAIIFIAVFLDIFLAGSKIHSDKREKAENRFPPLARIDFLKKDHDIFRVLTEVGDIDKRDIFLKNNWGSVYRIQNAGGYSPTVLSRFSDICKTPSKNLPLLLNIKYIITKYSLVNNAELVFNDGEYNVFKLSNLLPRAFFVEHCIIIEDKNEALNYLSIFDPKETVILEEDPNLKINESESDFSSSSDIEITKYTNNSIEINAQVPTNGLLVLSEIYYPGWNAYVDNVKAKIYRANYAFRAVILEKGKHKVSFVFGPASFYTGLIISIVSILFVILYLAIPYLKKPKVIKSFKKFNK